ncbi:MAG: hypothetical protein IT451_15245 [Candidatus Brocadia sp.]|nr:hypothetical protein [Candidatus Brocadia sp.]
MYSPKISEELIPKLYRLAKSKGVKMTTLVNEIIEKAIYETETTNGESYIKEE